MSVQRRGNKILGEGTILFLVCVRPGGSTPPLTVHTLSHIISSCPLLFIKSRCPPYYFLFVPARKSWNGSGKSIERTVISRLGDGTAAQGGAGAAGTARTPDHPREVDRNQAVATAPPGGAAAAMLPGVEPFAATAAEERRGGDAEAAGTTAGAAGTVADISVAVTIGGPRSPSSLPERPTSRRRWTSMKTMT